MPKLLHRARTALWLRALDSRDALTRSGRPLVPPRRYGFVGDSDFVATGDEFLGHFRALGGLTPADRVLDIGCGIGRMARPLTTYLDARGSYDGFDIHRPAIAWCRKHYAAFPAFRFQAADLRNGLYNRRGRVAAVDYRFPYDDDAFDFAFATSVFTHLQTDEARHYLREAARVLAPGGRLLATFLVLDAESRALSDRGAAAFPMHPHDAVSAVADPKLPEQAIAFDRDWIGGALAAAGFGAVTFHPGTWSGRADGTSFQDIVVARRVA